MISILEPRCPYQGLYFTSDWQNTLAYHGVEHTSQNMRRASQRIDITHVCCVSTYQDLVHCVSRQVLLKPQGVCSRACFNYIAIFVYSVGPVNDLSFTLKIQKPVFYKEVLQTLCFNILCLSASCMLLVFDDVVFTVVFIIYEDWTCAVCIKIFEKTVSNCLRIPPCNIDSPQGW